MVTSIYIPSSLPTLLTFIFAPQLVHIPPSKVSISRRRCTSLDMPFSVNLCWSRMLRHGPPHRPRHQIQAALISRKAILASISSANLFFSSASRSPSNRLPSTFCEPVFFLTSSRGNSSYMRLCFDLLRTMRTHKRFSGHVGQTCIGRRPRRLSGREAVVPEM